MSDFFSTAIAMQQEIIRAQRAQLDTARKMFDLGQQALDMQKSARQIADANARAMTAWASFWGLW